MPLCGAGAPPADQECRAALGGASMFYDADEGVGATQNPPSPV